MSWRVELAHLPAPLADGFIESYACWCEEAVEVRRAYHHWQGSGGAESATAFADYQVALDREELAAAVFRARVERISAELTAARDRVIQALR